MFAGGEKQRNAPQKSLREVVFNLVESKRNCGVVRKDCMDKNGIITADRIIAQLFVNKNRFFQSRLNEVS